MVLDSGASGQRRQSSRQQQGMAVGEEEEDTLVFAYLDIFL